MNLTGAVLSSIPVTGLSRRSTEDGLLMSAKNLYRSSSLSLSPSYRTIQNHTAITTHSIPAVLTSVLMHNTWDCHTQNYIGIQQMKEKQIIHTHKCNEQSLNIAASNNEGAKQTAGKSCHGSFMSFCQGHGLYTHTKLSNDQRLVEIWSSPAVWWLCH